MRLFINGYGIANGVTKGRIERIDNCIHYCGTDESDTREEVGMISEVIFLTE
jgi:hypothetical protein